MGKKLAAICLVTAAGIGAFATLGDGKSKTADAPKKSLLSARTAVHTGTFSLRSGYTYRGNEVIDLNGNKKYIRLNTVVTLQKGKTTYTVPLKKKVILDKVKLDFSNRQLKRD